MKNKKTFILFSVLMASPSIAGATTFSIVESVPRDSKKALHVHFQRGEIVSNGIIAKHWTLDEPTCVLSFDEKVKAKPMTIGKKKSAKIELVAEGLVSELVAHGFIAAETRDHAETVASHNIWSIKPNKYGVARVTCYKAHFEQNRPKIAQAVSPVELKKIFGNFIALEQQNEVQVAAPTAVPSLSCEEVKVTLDSIQSKYGAALVNGEAGLVLASKAETAKLSTDEADKLFDHSNDFDSALNPIKEELTKLERVYANATDVESQFGRVKIGLAFDTIRKFQKIVVNRIGKAAFCEGEPEQVAECISKAMVPVYSFVVEEEKQTPYSDFKAKFEQQLQQLRKDITLKSCGQAAE